MGFKMRRENLKLKIKVMAGLLFPIHYTFQFSCITQELKVKVRMRVLERKGHYLGLKK